MMTLDTMGTDFYETLWRHAEDGRVVLIHPESRYRTALVSRLLADPDISVFYYAVGTDDNDIQSFIAGFTHDMAEQAPTFGASINMVPLDDTTDLTALLNGFTTDLDQLSSEPYLLLLDEFDR